MKASERLRAWLSLWPFFLFLITIGPLNIDLIVIPSLTKGGIHILFWTLEMPNVLPKFSPTEVFLIVSGMSVVFTIYFYYFLGWFFHSRYYKNMIGKLVEKEPVQEGLRLWNKIRRQFRREIEKYCSKLHDWATNGDNKIIKRLRRWGYPGILIISMVPEPGTRTAATIFARSLNSKTALLMVLMGETVKNAIVLGFWNFAFWIF